MTNIILTIILLFILAISLLALLIALNDKATSKINELKEDILSLELKVNNDPSIRFIKDDLTKLEQKIDNVEYDFKKFKKKIFVKDKNTIHIAGNVKLTNGNLYVSDDVIVGNDFTIKYKYSTEYLDETIKIIHVGNDFDETLNEKYKCAIINIHTLRGNTLYITRAVINIYDKLFNGRDKANLHNYNIKIIGGEKEDMKLWEHLLKKEYIINHIISKIKEK